MSVEIRMLVLIVIRGNAVVMRVRVVSCGSICIRISIAFKKSLISLMVMGMIWRTEILRMRLNLLLLSPQISAFLLKFISKRPMFVEGIVLRPLVRRVAHFVRN